MSLERRQMCGRDRTVLLDRKTGSIGDAHFGRRAAGLRGRSRRNAAKPAVHWWGENCPCADQPYCRRLRRKHTAYPRVHTARAADLGAELVLFPGARDLRISAGRSAGEELVPRAGGARRCRRSQRSTAAGGPAILCGTALPATNPEGKHARNVAGAAGRAARSRLCSRRCCCLSMTYSTSSATLSRRHARR